LFNQYKISTQAKANAGIVREKYTFANSLSSVIEIIDVARLLVVDFENWP
jgi:hypothetical protein